MQTHAAFWCAGFLLISVGCRATAPPPVARPSDNAELNAIVAADQADRQPAIASIDWTEVSKRDAARRKQVLALIANDDLHTSKDFEQAALVFQHGDSADDILLAHVLAVTALGLNHPGSEGRRMAALTLDRYLTRSGQSQIFGTQFNMPDITDPTNWTMDPYNETLLSDSLRRLNCVESRAESRAILAKLRTGTEPEEPASVCGAEKTEAR